MRKIIIAITLFSAVILLVGAQVGFAWDTYEGGCQTCHGSGFSSPLHTIHTGQACTICHPGAAGAVPIPTSNCIVCHPPADPGLCPLIDVPTHAGIKNTCLACHTECAPVTTTTTVAPTTTTVAPTTTTVAPTTTTIISGEPIVDLGSATGNPCEQVILPITLTNDPPLEVAGVSMDIGYDPGFFTPISAAIGPAGEAAGKDVVSNIVSPGLFRVGVFSATDLSPIGDGIVANVTFEIDCFAPADTYVLSNTPMAATPAGFEVMATGSDGTITVNALVTTTTTSVLPTTTTTITGDTITICHIPPGLFKGKGKGPQPKTIIIPIKDLDDHLAHGDTIGPCGG